MLLFDGIPLILQSVSPPKGPLLRNIQCMALNVGIWFGRAVLPLPDLSYAVTAEASVDRSHVDHWTQKMNEAIKEQIHSHWSNLISGKLEQYHSTVVQRKNHIQLQILGNFLVKGFAEVSELCNAHGCLSMGRVILEEQASFRRANLAFLAMMQAMERTTNSWRITHFDTAAGLLCAVRFRIPLELSA